MNVLILCKYSRLGASSRVRFYQFVPRFEAAGIHCTIHPLLNDRYLSEIYERKRVSIWNLLSCYFSTMHRLLLADRFDLVLIEKEVFPFLPAFGEWWLNRRHIPYIVDYDDAIYHTYDMSSSRLVRFFLGEKIAVVMRRAAAVVCGNRYLGDYAREAGAEKVITIPTVIDPDRYVPALKGGAAGANEGAGAGPVVIGWIGSPTTMRYLEAMKPVLADLAARHNILVHIVAAGEGIGLGDAERTFQWTEENETSLISGFDIGIMPLEDSPWEKGKCGYKLIQYMACALPVVGSPVSANDDIIEEGVNGFKPGSQGEWRSALEELIADADLRKRMGGEGRRMVLDRYSIDVAAASWLEEMHSATAQHKEP